MVRYPISLKKLNYKQASNKFNLAPFGDADNDSFPNIWDCKPFDPNRDGFLGRTLNVLSVGKYGQSKEDYEQEKLEKEGTTHFVRDDTGKVIDVIKIGGEQKNYPVIGKTKVFLKNQMVDTGQKLVASSRDLKKDIKSKINPSIEDIKKRNAVLRKNLEHQKLLQERQKLLQEQQRLKAMGGGISPSTRELLNSLFPSQQPIVNPLVRPGYHIEQNPKLPKGYKWVKDKKIIETKSNTPKIVSNYVEHRFITFPEAQSFQHYMIQKYHYVPEIMQVSGFGQMFFVIVEPKIKGMK